VLHSVAMLCAVSRLLCVLQDPAQLEKLKKDLEAYREVMLPINKVIEWEQTYYPVILVAAITVIFS